MTIDQFAVMTHNVIKDGGFDDYQPTACFPERRVVAVLTGIPEGVDQEQAALAMIARDAKPGEEYLLGFKVDAARFKVIRHFDGEFEEDLFHVEESE